jgi:hypothetical protein
MFVPKHCIYIYITRAFGDYNFVEHMNLCNAMLHMFRYVSYLIISTIIMKTNVKNAQIIAGNHSHENIYYTL